MARDVNIGPAAEKKLERYGVWVKVEPRDVTRDLGGSLGLTDLESPASGENPARASFTDEEAHLLDELETGVGHEVAAGTREELESLDEQLSTPPADEELPELELEDAVDVPLADTGTAAGSFDDLETVEGGVAPAPADASGGPAVLSRIERELRSIRSDLSALKKELADLRRPGAPAARAGAAPGPKAGFFEEEEDDRIALTGDELDNILNTADITEESAEAPAAAADAAEVTEPAADLEEVADEPQPPGGGDILAYEEPAAASAVAAEPVEELEEITDLELESPDAAPAELVLEEAGAGVTEAGDLPTLDLEGIPEIEGGGEAELEELPADEEAADLEEAPDTPGTARSPAAAEVELEAPGAAQDAGHESILSTDDLAASDLAELEAVAEDSSAADGASIEIDFEQAAAPAESPAGVVELEPAEEAEAVEDLEEVTEAVEEAPPAAAAPVREPEPPRPARQPQPAPATGKPLVMDETLKNDLRNVLGVIDELLDALPEKKIREFAKSEHFAIYKKLFEDLDLDKE